jgi:hypothetical protein
MSCSELSNSIPTLGIQLNNYLYTLTWESYARSFVNDSGNPNCVLNIGSNKYNSQAPTSIILGVPFMEAFYTEYTGFFNATATSTAG